MPADTPPPRRKWHFQRWLTVFIVATLCWSGWRAYAFRSALAEALALGWTVGYTDPVETIRADWKAAFKKKTWLDGVRFVRPATMAKLEQHLDMAHRLNPRGLWIHNDPQLFNLSVFTKLSGLRRVGIAGCSGLTDVDALRSLPFLQDVRLIDCTGLTDVDAFKYLNEVGDICLNGCIGLSNVDALAHLSTLRFLGLSGCTRLKNMDALKRLTSLRHVDLAGCTGLTNVDALKTLPSLQQVDLGGCTGLTTESVAALKAALPNARISGP